MKKFIYATLALAAVLLFASCKNDKNQPKNEKADAYISFTFNLPQGGFRDGVADKTAGQEYAGTADEQAIKGVRVVLFDETSGIVKYALTYNITGTGSAAPTGDIAGTATTANFTTKAKAVVSQDYQMLAIINPTAEVIAATEEGKYLKDAQTAITSDATKLSANGIMMSNEQGLVKVAAGDMKATEAEAEAAGAPIKVNVDRILAKVFVGGTPKFENGKLTNIKWGLNVTNKKTFIYRQLAQVMESKDNFVAEAVKDGSKRFDRYAKDPNFLAGEFNATDFTYLEGTPELKGTFGYADANGQYCLENTMDAPMQKHQGTTSFILSGTWTPAEHDGITFTPGETWYSYMGFTFTKAKMLDYKRIIDDNTNTKTEIDKTPAGFKAALKAALASMNVDAEGDVAASGTFNGIKAYKDGACYYQTNLIRHFNNDQSSKDMGYGRYGVVRNNIYKINITKITQPGEPDVVNEKDDDKDDDPTKVFVAFDVTINPWIVRTQDISL
ncbi:Mfa1 family fimbria major subunit [uncultured Porphyromonas sp.]|uniref:Mfa1 family fimbria major subunit n=1 Tax=uncultured Porphyromonas sp. TaxID=159274 RepID=UPI0028062350|nr:Mfa1 family fimbria major subunit [uncultured Porphyromonas sp.]